jgi:hypothetical protein
VTRQHRPKTTERTDPRARIAALALLDRAFSASTDDELGALAAAATEDQQRELANLIGAPLDDAAPAAIRAAAVKGRMNGVAEAIAALLIDAVLVDCIDKLGDNADLPSSEELLAVTPGLVERHGLGGVRLMMASAVCGAAPATAVLVELLRHDDTLKLPPAEPVRVTAPPVVLTPEEQAERDRVKAARAERKEREKQAAAARRAQTARRR